MVCGSKAKFVARYIDTDKVEKWKSSVNGNISTNDILTSSFSKATKSDLLLMAINLRKRVPDAGENDAGNYSLVVLHDSESSSTPSNVRQVLSDGPPFVRKKRKFPGFVTTINSRVSMITNWAFPDFNADTKLCNSSGECNIPLELHLPIPYNPGEVAFPIALVFKPCPGKLAILYGGSPQQVSSDKLSAAKVPFGQEISSKMFPSQVD